MGFKENLKSEIQYKGILVKELAAKSGIKKKTIDNYLSTHNSIPKADAAVKIAKALETTVEFLVTGKDEAENKISDLQELVERYKKLPKEKKKLVMDVLKNL